MGQGESGKSTPEHNIEPRQLPVKRSELGEFEESSVEIASLDVGDQIVASCSRFANYSPYDFIFNVVGHTEQTILENFDLQIPAVVCTAPMRFSVIKPREHSGIFLVEDGLLEKGSNFTMAACDTDSKVFRQQLTTIRHLYRGHKIYPDAYERSLKLKDFVLSREYSKENFREEQLRYMSVEDIDTNLV